MRQEIIEYLKKISEDISLIISRRNKHLAQIASCVKEEKKAAVTLYNKLQLQKWQIDFIITWHESNPIVPDYYISKNRI